MTSLGKRLLLGALLAHALLLIGCGGKSMGRYNIDVALDPALVAQTPSITVNIIAPPKAEEARWSAQSMTEYWMPDNQVRADSRDRIKEFQFGPGNTDTKRLSDNDPLWEKWSGSENIYVLAYLPNARGDAMGEADTRRLILPRDKAWWKDVTTIKVRVQRGQLILDTPKTPPPPPK